MSLEQFLTTELQALSTEVRKKNNNVKEAVDRAQVLFKSVKSPASPEKKSEYIAELAKKDDIVKALILCFETKNPKVAFIAVGILQRLVQYNAISETVLPITIAGLNECMDLGSDVQLKLLQTILGLVTNYDAVHGPTLFEALLICLRLYNTKIHVLTSAAAATLSQLVLILFDKVVKEADELKDEGIPTKLSGETPALALQKLPPSARDAFMVLQDLCLLTLGEQAEFLTIAGIGRSLGLELIEAVLSTHYKILLKYPSFHVLLIDRVCPLVIRTYSDRSSYPQTMRLMRVMRALLKHFNQLLTMQCEIFLTTLVKTMEIHNPLWQRALALEVFRAICSDINSLRQFFRNYDQQQNSNNVFADMVNSCSKAVQTGAEQSSQMSMSQLSDVSLTNVAPTFPIVTLKVSCMDQLDKHEAPSLPDGYLPSLALSCLVAITDSIASEVLPLFIPQTPPDSNKFLMTVHPVDIDKHPQHELLSDCRAMLLSIWNGLLFALAMVVAHSVDEEMHAMLLRTFQSLTMLCGVMGLVQERDAFIMNLCRFAMPTWEEGGITEQSFQAICTVFNIAQSLGGMLGPAWYYILELLQSVEVALKLVSTSTSNPPTPSITNPSVTGLLGIDGTGTPTASTPQQSTATAALTRKRTATSQEENVAVLVSLLGKLFAAVSLLDDDALLEFIEALSKLATESSKPKAKAALKAMHPNSGAEIRSFGMERLMETALSTLPRLLVSSGEGAWTAIVNFLLLAAAAEDIAIRHQASETVSALCTKALATGQTMRSLDEIDDLQRRLLSPVLSLCISSHSEVQVHQLETLYQLLQTHGQTFTSTWPMILDALRQVADQDLHHSRSIVQDAATVRIAFQSLQFICTDLLSNLQVDALHQVIGTLGRFSLQPSDVNIALTAVGLMWSIADFARGCRNRLTREVDDDSPDAPVPKPSTIEDVDSLWLSLLTELGQISADERPEVRNGATQTLFRTISINGALFQPSTWHTCLWKVLFTLLDSVKAGAKQHASERLAKAWGRDHGRPNQSIILHHTRNTTEKQWDETRVIAFKGVCSSFHRHFATLVPLDGFKRAWMLLLEFFEDFSQHYGQEVSIAALQSFEEVLQYPKKEVSDELAGQLDDYWRSAWLSWEKVGLAIVKMPGTTQDSLVAFVRSFSAIYHLLGESFSVHDCRRLLTVLRGVITYPYDDMLLRDVDNTTPLQTLVLNQVMRVDPSLNLTGDENNDSFGGGEDEHQQATAPANKTTSPSAELRSFVLTELATYVLFAFKEKEPTLSSLPASASSLSISKDGEDQQQQQQQQPPPTPVAVTKPAYCATYLALCRRSMDRLVEVFDVSLDIAALYETGVFEKIIASFGVPMKLRYDCPAPRSNKAAIWKSAVKDFLLVIKSGLRALDSLHDQVSPETITRIWKQTINVFRGYLLYSCTSPANLTPEELDDDELFDVAVVNSIRTELVPLMRGVPTPLILSLVEIFQEGSSLLQEPETGNDYILTREKFAASCLSTLFALSAEPPDFASLPPQEQKHRREIGSVVARIMVERCESVIRSYLHEKAIHGNLPVARTRNDELLFILSEISKLELMSGVLKMDGRMREKSLTEGRNAHLFYLYPTIVECITSGDRAVVEVVRSILRRVGLELGLVSPTPSRLYSVSSSSSSAAATSHSSHRKTKQQS